MNVFLLTPILGCVSEVVCDEMSEAVGAYERVSSCLELGVTNWESKE